MCGWRWRGPGGQRPLFPGGAQAIRDACDGQRAVCVSLVREKDGSPPPKLYDLTTLQREANRVFGYTAKQTLDYAQSLYEKKLLTYPDGHPDLMTWRGDRLRGSASSSTGATPLRCLPGVFPDVLALMERQGRYSTITRSCRRWNWKRLDVWGLPVGERNILLLVCCKLLCAAAEPFVYEAVTATFDCGGHTTARENRCFPRAGAPSRRCSVPP